IRESRVRKPFLRSEARSSGLNFASARDNPIRTAPACPPTPPPFAVTTTSTCSARLVNFNGSMASCFQAKFGKYCSTVRLLMVNLPDPARRNTRATDSLRGPVPRNQFVPAMGVPVELNDPPRLQTVPHSRTRKLHASGCPLPRAGPPRRVNSLLDEGRHRNVRQNLHTNRNLETGMLQAANPPEQQSPNLNDYSATGCGFCPM